MFFIKFFNNQICKIFATKIIIPGNRPYLKNIVKQLKNGNIKSSSTKVKNKKTRIIIFLEKSIGNCCRRWLAAFGTELARVSGVAAAAGPASGRCGLRLRGGLLAAHLVEIPGVDTARCSGLVHPHKGHGGPLHYDGASGKLVCDYCGSAYDVKDIEARYAKKQAAADTAAEGDAKKAARLPRQDSPVWSEAETEGLNSYSCPTCGAELVCDETTAATTCPYCGNPTVLGGKLSGKLKPEYIRR